MVVVELGDCGKVLSPDGACGLVERHHGQPIMWGACLRVSSGHT